MNERSSLDIPDRNLCRCCPWLLSVRLAFLCIHPAPRCRPRAGSNPYDCDSVLRISSFASNPRPARGQVAAPRKPGYLYFDVRTGEIIRRYLQPGLCFDLFEKPRWIMSAGGRGFGDPNRSCDLRDGSTRIDQQVSTSGGPSRY